MSQIEPKSGFECEGVYYPWHLTDKVKDLQIIDHFAKMPPQEFFAAVEDDFDRSRTPILAAMMATSVRHARPEWSRDKVIRFIEDINMSDIEFFDGEDDEDEEKPAEGEEGGGQFPPASTLLEGGEDTPDS